MMFPPLQWDELRLKVLSWLRGGYSKDICNSRWNVTLYDMKTKFKQVRIHLQNLLGENSPKGVKNHPRRITC
jgi:hypothetical protein